ncbi:MAG: hypothetical protein JWO63_1229 [Frankiales bacterium]|nr:hypothetical protein [Frankiales bacterium]
MTPREAAGSSGKYVPKHGPRAGRAEPAPAAVPPGAPIAHPLVAQAAQVKAELCAQDAQWGTSGWTRRRFLAGAGMAGVAALGTQLVTTRVAYGATPDATSKAKNTLITIFLRGAADGLGILVPATTALGIDYLHRVRPTLVPATANLLPLSGTAGWALNKAMAPLMPFWNTGELSFVPAVSSPGITRSHFQAQQYVEHGGSDTATTGWLDRVLTQLGPGTTFRALAEGSALPVSMSGNQKKLAINSLKSFTFPAWSGIAAQTEAAVAALYRGHGGTIDEDVADTLAALGTAAKAEAKAGVQNGAVYPSGDFGTAMADLATLLRAEVGLQVATVDVGGWDTHTDEVHDLNQALTATAATLAAFLTDLGPTRRKRVTVVVVTEFGRRVMANASGGTDHGHGSVMWLLGGGVAGKQVHGRWSPLSDASLDQGDVPGLNDAFSVLGELAQKRLGVGSLSAVFPGHKLTTLGVATA